MSGTDLISRQLAIELIHSLYPSAPLMRINRKRWEEKYKPYIEAEKALEQLPSAQPEHPKGKWIEYIPEHGQCPFCGNQVDLLGGKANNFCGECGADMRGERDG